MTNGLIMAPLFFIALFIAAISSLIAMLELAVRVIMDYGYTRHQAVTRIGILAVIAGIPSALSLNFFNNQDWVWGIGLLLSGFFFVFFTLKTGINTFVKKYLRYEQFSLLKKNWFIKYLLFITIIEFLSMFLWWFFQSINWYPQHWWNPFDQLTIGTCLFQWIIVISIGYIFRTKLSRIRNN
jgi:NSS family neurotransmitter:Na+ symporter